MKHKTFIIDGDTDEVLETRIGKRMAISVETFNMLRSQYGKEVIWTASNGCYGLNATVFILREVKHNE